MTTIIRPLTNEEGRQYWEGIKKGFNSGMEDGQSIASMQICEKITYLSIQLRSSIDKCHGEDVFTILNIIDDVLAASCISKKAKA